MALVRTMAPPKQTDMIRMWGEASSSDPQGKVLYRGATPFFIDTATLADGVTVRQQHQADSISIVRGVFQTRSFDTVARLKLDNTTRTLYTMYPGGRTTLQFWLHPLTPIDEWAALSDGTITLVRGHDYHVDVVLPNGTQKSTDTLPFD